MKMTSYRYLLDPNEGKEKGVVLIKYETKEAQFLSYKTVTLLLKKKITYKLYASSFCFPLRKLCGNVGSQIL